MLLQNPICLAILALACFCSLTWAEPKPGSLLTDATLRDATDRPSTIPDFGKKVLLILYTDPDVADQNDPLSDAIKIANFSEAFYRSISILNRKDAPAKTDWIVRGIIRSKIKKYGSTLLNDSDRLLVQQWGLGECDGKSVVILIGKDRQVVYLKKNALSQSDRDAVLTKIREQIKAAGGPLSKLHSQDHKIFPTPLGSARHLQNLG